MSKRRLSRRGFLRGGSSAVAPAPAAPPAPLEARKRAAMAVAMAPREARVLAFECIGPTSFCSTCVERCSVPGALTLSPAGTPRVDASLCDGFGACEDACPAPSKAIVVIPRLGGR